MAQGSRNTQLSRYSPSATLSPKDLFTTAINKLGRGKPHFSYLDKIAASCLEKAGRQIMMQPKHEVNRAFYRHSLPIIPCFYLLVTLPAADCSG